jgi:spore germination cell wall hydrolase CwlJ-like protein
MATVSDNNAKSKTPAVTSTARDRRPAHTEPSVEAIAAEAAAIYPDTIEGGPTAEEIAAEAYAIYEARGGEHGRDQDDWLEAERRLQERRNSPR